jgi:hypothetical protein
MTKHWVLTYGGIGAIDVYPKCMGCSWSGGHYPRDRSGSYSEAITLAIEEGEAHCREMFQKELRRKEERTRRQGVSRP